MQEMRRIHRTNQSQARTHITDAMIADLGWEKNSVLHGVIGQDKEVHLTIDPGVFRGRLNVVPHYNAITLPWFDEGKFAHRVRCESHNGVLTIKFYEEELWVRK